MELFKDIMTSLNPKSDRNRSTDGLLDESGGNSNRDQANSSVSTIKSEIDHIQVSIHDCKRRLRDFEYHSDRLVEANRRLEDELRDLESQTGETNREISFVDQDLGVTRFHAPDEDTMTNAQLVEGFKQVINSVHSLVKELDSWYYNDIHISLSASKAKAISETFNGGIGKEEVDPFLSGALHANKDLGRIFRALMYYYACSSLLEHVFEPFIPGRPSEETIVLLEAQYFVQEMESQSSSGRWRALTYRTALESRVTSWYTAPASQFVEYFSHILHIFGNIQLNDQKYRSAVQFTENMFKVATDFKDSAMMMCTDVNFRVYLPSSKQKVDPTRMEEVWSSRASETVSLGVGLGLEVYRYRQEVSRNVEKQYIAAHGVIIGNRSHLFPSARSYIAAILGNM